MASSVEHCSSTSAEVGGFKQLSAVDALRVMWGPALQSVPYQSGQNLIPFESLWPEGRTLESYLDGFNQNELNHIILECCRWAIACGPVRILRTLIDKQLVPVDQILQPGGTTLLHMSCIFRNTEAVELLCRQSALWKRDDKGRTPSDVCYCPLTKGKIRASKKSLPLSKKLNSPFPWSKQDALSAHSQMFELAHHPHQVHELQVLLQETKFDVNKEKNGDGELLVHVAVRGGISQVPLLLSLHKIQNMQVDVFDDKGATPLCIAAGAGNEVMIDVLICLLGADVNLPNSKTGETPLHYASHHNNPSVLNCLLNRGASCNIEDKSFLLPDTLAKQAGHEECMTLVMKARAEKAERVNYLIAQGLMRPGDIHASDQYVIDASGYTPLMVAAQQNRVDMIIYLGKLVGCPLNGQHLKTGKTALSMCAEMGHLESLTQLLEILAARSKETLWKSFRIHDFEKKWLPLHYACANNHVGCVEELLKHQEGLVGLSKARRLTSAEKLVLMLGQAIERRQREVVEPILLKAVTTGVLEASINPDNNSVNDIGMGQTLASLELEDDDEINPTDEAGNWPLFIAAKKGFLEVVKYLYQVQDARFSRSIVFLQPQASMQLDPKTNGLQGYVTCRNPKTGWTPLHVAARYGHLNVVRFLLQFCRSSQHEILPVNEMSENPCVGIWMDVDAQGMKGETALVLAVAEGYSHVVKALLDAGASATKPDNSGNLLSCRQFPGVQVLLERSRERKMTRIAEVIANRRQNIEKLRNLWKAPYDHNLRDKYGNSPLMLCCVHGHKNFVQFLLQSVPPFELTDAFVREFLEGCDIDEEGNNEKVNQVATTETTYTKEHQRRSTMTDVQFEINLSKQNSLDLKRLQSNTVDTNSQCMPPTDDPFSEFRGDYRPETPFRSQLPPAILGDREITSTILYSDLNSLSFDGKYLLACNPDNGKSALHYAAESGIPRIVAQLLAVDQRCVLLQDKKGRTPLHIACRKNKMAIVKQLRDISLTNPCVRDNSGKRPEDLVSNSSIKLKVVAAREEFMQRAMTAKGSIVSQSSSHSVSNSSQGFRTEGSQGAASVCSPKSIDSPVGKLSMLLKQQRHAFAEHQAVHDHKDQFHKLLDSLPSVPSIKEEKVASIHVSGKHWWQPASQYAQTLESSIDYDNIRGRFEKLKIATGTRHYCPSMHDADQHG